MKYIRMKNGRMFSFYEVEEKSKVVIGYSTEKELRYLDSGRYLYKDKILKLADTVEELFDEYVLDSNPVHASRTPIKIDFEKKIIYQWQSEKTVTEYTFEQFLPFHTIYGAIWVVGKNNEPILKSVAKMDEKGVSELLWTED